MILIVQAINFSQPQQTIKLFMMNFLKNEIMISPLNNTKKKSINMKEIKAKKLIMTKNKERYFITFCYQVINFIHDFIKQTWETKLS
jgi:hypothetical protein